VVVVIVAGFALMVRPDRPCFRYDLEIIGFRGPPYTRIGEGSGGGGPVGTSGGRSGAGGGSVGGMSGPGKGGVGSGGSIGPISGGTGPGMGSGGGRGIPGSIGSIGIALSSFAMMSA
jgi:hypothetical protein